MSTLSVPLVTNSVVAAATQWPGGVGVLLAVSSAWAAGSCALQFLLPDGATWSTVATLSANGTSAFTLPLGQVRALVSGSPTALYASASAAPSNLN